MLGTENLVVLLAILALFGYHGYRRGVQLEAVFTFTIVGARILITHFGNDITRYANNLHWIVQFVLAGGLGASDPGRFLQSVQGTTAPLVSKASQEVFLITFFLVVIGLAYWLSRLIWKMAKSWVGGMLGALNGYLLLYYFLPLLGGKAPEAAELARTTTDRAADLVSSTPVRALTKQDGASALLLLIIGIVVVIAARSVQPSKGKQG